jgi:uncharacterized protein (TIGR02145 family)
MRIILRILASILLATIIFACINKHKDISVGSSSSEEVSSSSIDLCEGFVKDTTKFCDSRDGKKYAYKKIDTQTWMAENLNYDADGSKCYGNKPANCEKFGRLYDWDTAMKSCPKDWHLPSDAEWTTLVNYVDNEKGCSTLQCAGTKLKANNGKFIIDNVIIDRKDCDTVTVQTNCAGTKLKATDGWNTSGDYIPGTDDYSFSALPGGSGNAYGKFMSIGYRGSWWTSSENNNNSNLVYYRYMEHKFADVSKANYSKTVLNSVRCVQN